MRGAKQICTAHFHEHHIFYLRLQQTYAGPVYFGRHEKHHFFVNLQLFEKLVRWCLFITFVDFTIFTDFVSTKVPQISDFFDATYV